MDNLENHICNPCVPQNTCRNICGNSTKKAVNIIGSCGCCPTIKTCDDVCKCFCDTKCCGNLCRNGSC